MNSSEVKKLNFRTRNFLTYYRFGSTLLDPNTIGKVIYLAATSVYLSLYNQVWNHALVEMCLILVLKLQMSLNVLFIAKVE